MSKRSKDHHIVPKALRKQFATEGEKIWYSERGDDGSFSAPELRNIKSTFWRRNYYTVLDQGAPSDVVERKFYGSLDDYLGKVIPDVLAAFERGEVPVFSGEALDTIRLAALEMMKRTPDFHQSKSDEEIGIEFVKTMLAKLDHDASDARRQELLSILSDSQKLVALGRDIRVRGTIRPMERVIEALDDFTVRWAKCETKHSFLLSSLIGYRIGNGGSNGFANPDMEFWMPISPKVALVLLRDPGSSVPHVTIERPSHVREVNEFAARNSAQIASHSQLLLESITRRRAKSD